MTDSLSPVEATAQLPSERRAWIRYGSDNDILCHSRSPRKDYGWSGKIRNISSAGIGLLLRHRFRPGTPLLIELADRLGKPVRTIPARVVHASAARSESGTCWLIGCTFAYAIPEEEVQTIRS